MRIVQINTHSEGGGAAQVARTLHRSYREAGHDAVLLCGFGTPDAVNGIEILAPALSKRLLQVAAYRLSGVDGMGNATRWQQLQQTLLSQADIIHLHNAHGYYLPQPMLQRLCRGPLVWTLHDQWLMTGRCGSRRGCTGHAAGCAPCPHRSYYPASLTDHAAAHFVQKRDWARNPGIHFVSPSEFLQNELAKAGIQPPHHQVIPNPVDLPDDLRPLLRPMPTPFRLVFLADRPFDPIKGLALLRQAINALPHPERFTLSIIGHAALKERKRLGAVACPVTWMGKMSDRAILYRTLREHDALVAPSQTESFGLSAMEGFAATGRVLCSDLSAFKEVLGDRARFVPRHDAGAWTQALERLTQDGSDSSWETSFFEPFKANRIAASYLELYRQVRT